MKLRTLTFTILMLQGIFLTFAQKESTIGEVTLNESFHNSLQLLHPDFFYSEDSLIYTTNLLKHYVFYKAIHDTINTATHLRNDELKNDHDLFMKMAEDYYWANWASKQSQENLTANLDSIRAYYEKNKQKYAVDGVYTFVQSYVSDEKHKSSVFQKMKEIASTFEKSGQLSKDASGPWAINIEQNLTIRKGDLLFNLLETTPQGQISTPLKSENFQVYVLPIKVKKYSIRPFDEVRLICEQDYLNDLNIRNEEIFRKSVLEKYPIKLN